MRKRTEEEELGEGGLRRKSSEEGTEEEELEGGGLRRKS